MSDDLTVPCPNCGHAVPLTEGLVGPRLDAIRAEMAAETDKALAAQRQTVEAEAMKKAQAEIARTQDAAKQREADMEALQRDLSEARQAARDAKSEQAKLLKAQRALEERAADMDLEVQRRVSEEAKKEAERQKQRAEAQAEVKTAAALEALNEKLAEKDAEMAQKLEQANVQADAMRRQIEALKQKSEQGSMQVQGEAAELILEDRLRRAFPADRIDEVGKGIRGADCLQTVAGAGAILWESKNARNWSNDWAPKLRADMRTAGADLAVLVSTARPDGIDTFEARDGIWICAPRFVLALAGVLRHSLAEISQARAARQGQATKTEMLYDYLTGPGFRARVEAMLEPFEAMQTALAQEKRALTKQWALREKQLDKAIEAVSGMYGDVQGIAGSSVLEIDGLSMPLLNDDECL
ncbi:MAG: DUF2130 domain-containing protein [Pseudomonadota bacterium]